MAGGLLTGGSEDMAGGAVGADDTGGVPGALGPEVGADMLGAAGPELPGVEVPGNTSGAVSVLVGGSELPPVCAHAHAARAEPSTARPPR
jgi:hypothetical protein